MNVYAMNECDWWIGESLEACIADCIEETGDPDCIEDPQELNGKLLESLTYFSDEDYDDGEPITRTFKEQLDIEIALGGVFPRRFASAEY